MRNAGFFFFRLLIWWFIAGVILTIVCFFVFDLSFSKTHKSKIQLKPDVIIESKSVNGIQTTDTTYLYHLK